MLYQADEQAALGLLDDPAIEIGLHSATSTIAAAARAGTPARVFERPDGAVVDRQLLRMLDAEEALVMPVRTGELTMVLLAAQEEERDMAVAAEIYAEELARHVHQIAVGTAAAEEPMQQLQLFREHEHQRLREIVHEANNPLSIVRNYLHILQMRLQHEPEAVEQLDLIATELSRAADIIGRARGHSGRSRGSSRTGHRRAGTSRGAGLAY